MSRTATLERATKETSVKVTVDLDGTGASSITLNGAGFFAHMLDQLAKHSLVDITVEATGDVEIDDHHLVEDVGITLGQAIQEALGDKRGIRRYASIDLPMDAALSRAAVDVSGRPFLVWRVEFTAPKIGTFDTELVREFFQAFAMNAGITLHMESAYGANSHHIAESLFKAVARSLRDALAIDPRVAGDLPTTKGVL
ncbi:MAG: imidazoleglycerol-phosphate dehydratase HisB [Cohaesibacteraceae bacterium]